jgi:hypothetical protein
MVALRGETGALMTSRCGGPRRMNATDACLRPFQDAQARRPYRLRWHRRQAELGNGDGSLSDSHMRAGGCAKNRPWGPLSWYTGRDMCHNCSLGGCIRREDKMIGVRCCMRPLHPPTRGVYQAWTRDLAWFPCQTGSLARTYRATGRTHHGVRSADHKRARS